MSSKIPLTSSLMDQILFAMEDQENLYVLNLATRQIILSDGESIEEEASVIPLPSWSSTDGFRMMREFSESLHNPTVQADLKGILDGGQGVFKKFKQALKPHDFLFRNWLRFKRRFMENAVREWIRQWGLALDLEAEALLVGAGEPVLLEDFQILVGGESDREMLQRFDQTACLEAGGVIFGEASATDFQDYWRGGVAWKIHDRLYKALSPDGSWAGVLWARPWTSKRNGETTIEVLLWYVLPEYRGLKLGTSLLERFREESVAKKDERILFKILPWDNRMNRVLTRLGLQSVGQFWGSTR